MSISRRFSVFLVLAALLAGPCPAQQAVPPTAPAQQAAAPLSPSQKAFIASKIYAAVPLYFAHWQGAPDLDLDAAYRRYLDAALAAPDRFAFDMASKEFVAGLHNSHSGFSDTWLRKNYGQPMGFDARFLAGKWVVTRSDLPALKVGKIIAAVDGLPAETLYQEKKKYLSASSDRAARSLFFYASYLFPQRVTLTLADGRHVAIDRTQNVTAPEAEKTTGRWLRKGTLACIRIPSFDDPKFEQTALDYLKQYRNAGTLIIDVRGNGGGSTPSLLVDALMERPYRFWAEATPINVGLLSERAGEAGASPGAPVSEEQKGYTEAFAELANHPHLYWPASFTAPESPIFKGRLLLLTDGDCFSACEDFLVPFKDNKRATLIGETTGGSSGQPYSCDLGDGMSFRISTKREFLPDGDAFEGVGIRPDVEAQPTLADIAAGRDVALLKAVGIAGRP